MWRYARIPFLSFHRLFSPIFWFIFGKPGVVSDTDHFSPPPSPPSSSLSEDGSTFLPSFPSPASPETDVFITQTDQEEIYHSIFFWLPEIWRLVRIVFFFLVEGYLSIIFFGLPIQGKMMVPDYYRGTEGERRAICSNRDFWSIRWPPLRAGRKKEVPQRGVLRRGGLPLGSFL